MQVLDSLLRDSREHFILLPGGSILVLLSFFSILVASSITQKCFMETIKISILDETIFSHILSY